MIKNLKINDNWNALQHQYVCDEIADLDEIKDAPFSSIAFVIEDGKSYILNGSKEWVEYAVVESSAPSGSSLPEIGENDSGKVLTVVEGTEEEETILIPEQSVTLLDTPVALANADLSPIEDGSGLQIPIMVNGDELTFTGYSETDGGDKYVNLSYNVSDSFEYNVELFEGIVYFYAGNPKTSATIPGTYAVSCVKTIVTPTGELTAQWTESNSGNVITFNPALNTYLQSYVQNVLQECVAANNNTVIERDIIYRGDVEITEEDYNAVKNAVKKARNGISSIATLAGEALVISPYWGDEQGNYGIGFFIPKFTAFSHVYRITCDLDLFPLTGQSLSIGSVSCVCEHIIDATQAIDKV